MISPEHKKELNLFIPGFTMGIVRSVISHPFEMLKLKSLLKDDIKLLKDE